MPNVRKLAYRDRFVWELIQTVQGGSSTLPPLQFSPSVVTPVLVEWTEEQWIRVFSALMTGADLTYPEQSHQVVWDLLQFIEYPIENPVQTMQSSFQLFGINVKRGVNDAGNAVGIVTDANAYGGYYVRQNPPAQFDQVHYKLFMASGDYYIRHVWHRNTNCGQLTIGLIRESDNAVISTSITNLNMAGALAYNQVVEGTFSLDEPGAYRLVLSVPATTGGGYFHLHTQTYLWKQETII